MIAGSMLMPGTYRAARDAAITQYELKYALNLREREHMSDEQGNKLTTQIDADTDGDVYVRVEGGTAADHHRVIVAASNAVPQIAQALGVQPAELPTHITQGRASDADTGWDDGITGDGPGRHATGARFARMITPGVHELHTVKAAWSYCDDDIGEYVVYDTDVQRLDSRPADDPDRIAEQRAEFSGGFLAFKPYKQGDRLRMSFGGSGVQATYVIDNVRPSEDGIDSYDVRVIRDDGSKDRRLPSYAQLLKFVADIADIDVAHVTGHEPSAMVPGSLKLHWLVRRAAELIDGPGDITAPGNVSNPTMQPSADAWQACTFTHYKAGQTFKLRGPGNVIAREYRVIDATPNDDGTGTVTYTVEDTRTPHARPVTTDDDKQDDARGDVHVHASEDETSVPYLSVTISGDATEIRRAADQWGMALHRLLNRAGATPPPADSRASSPDMRPRRAVKDTPQA